MTQKVTDCGDGLVKVRTCAWSPPGCHPVGCGVILSVQDGKVVKVEGDPEHPITQGRLCPRCLALDETIYHEDRLLYPMKRAREDRGKDKWERITWEEGLDILEKNVKEIREKYGYGAIAFLTGTGRQCNIYAQATAFGAFQTPNFDLGMSGITCYGSRSAVTNFTLGAGYPELDYAQYFEDRYDHPGYEIPKFMLIWGKNPIYSSGDGLFGHAVVDLMKLGSKLIVVDPQVTWLAVRAEHFLQLRPGTDAALALGMLNVIINEDLYDHEFVDEWCYGFEELKERVQEYPLDLVEKITWVSADKIAAAARDFANATPCSALWGLAIETAQNGTQACHAFLDLITITGNLDIPGGISLAMPNSLIQAWGYALSSEIPPDGWMGRISTNEFPCFDQTSTNGHPDLILEAIETGEPAPIKGVYFHGTNPFASTCFARPDRWYNAIMENVEFVATAEIFMTPTVMAVCDLVFPVTTFAEQDGVVLPHFGRNTHFIGAMNKAIDAGEAKSDIEIMLLFGKRLNSEEVWPWNTPEEFLDYQFASAGLTFEQLSEEVAHMQPHSYYKYEKGMLRMDGKPGFNTPTRKVELKSSLYARWEEDPLPYFEEPFYSPYSKPEMAREFPLVLTTGGRRITSFHSEHRQIESLRAIDPDPVVTIHPDTAAAAGIKDGDWVLIENPEGRCVERAKISPVVDPRVVHATHGWWFPEEDGEYPNLFGVWKSNINTLIPHKKVGKLGYGANYKSVICRISKVDSKDCVEL